MMDFLSFQKNLRRQEAKTRCPKDIRNPQGVRHSQDIRSPNVRHANSGTVSSHKTAYRPKSIVSRAKNNTSILTQIRQQHKPRPLYARRGISQTVNTQEYINTDLADENKARQNPRRANIRHKARIGKPRQNARHDNVRHGNTRSSSFSMPLLPAMLLLIIGTVLLLYNRTNISSLMQRNVVSLAPLEDSGAANMASVMNIPGVSETGIAAVPDPTTHIAIPEAVVPHINITEGTVAEEAQDDIPLKMVDYFSWIDHTVKSGESVSRIADSYGLSMETVIASNNLTNAHLLRPGQILKIPNMNGIPYVIKSGDNLSKISKAWSIPLSVIVDANNLQSDFIMPGQTIFLPGARMPANDLRMALGTLFVSPLKGSGSRLSSAFGWREDPFDGGQRLHEAIDMAAPTGTPVKAASSGRVSMVGNSPTYGKYIIISHSGGFQTLYAHLSVIVVQQGAQVDQGTKIGEVGSTGRSTGPHLHFALYKDDKAVNPLDYLSM